MPTEPRVRITAAKLKPLVVNLIRVAREAGDRPEPQTVEHLKVWAEVADLILAGKPYDMPFFESKKVLGVKQL
jgi:hypothetical protein